MRASFRYLLSALVLACIPALLIAEPSAPAVSPDTSPAASQPEMLPAAVPTAHPVIRAQGYKGFWYGPVRGRPPMPGARLSGGVAFEPMEHTPAAHYVQAADRTFFVYVGAGEGPGDAPQASARMMVGCYDHKDGTFAAPVTLLDGLPPGARGCPALSVDEAGRLWVFISVLDADYPSAIYRSVLPHEISEWEKVTDLEFHKPQAWYVPGRGCMLLHVLMVEDKPRVHFRTSPDGLSWSKPAALATFGEGQSCISGRNNNKIAVAMTYREPGHGVESRSDLYYLETVDFGQTWNVLPRQKVDLPLAEEDNPARVFDHGDWRFFLRDLQFDPMGNPVVLYTIRHQRRAMPAADSRVWTTTRWTGREWETTAALFSDSDYDGGCIEVERLIWHVTKPSMPGPQPNRSGGEIVRWRSEDQGRSWYPQPLTSGSSANHNWVRRVVDGRPELLVLWADGNARSASRSRLYFADRDGNVYALPDKMEGDSAKPELIHKAPEPQTQPEEGTTAPQVGGEEER